MTEKTETDRKQCKSALDGIKKDFNQLIDNLLKLHEELGKLIEYNIGLMSGYKERDKQLVDTFTKKIETKKAVMNIGELSGYIGRKKSWIYAHIEKIPHNQKGEKGTLFFKKNEIDGWLRDFDIPGN